MSVKNFIPELWSKKIMKELDKQHMLVKNCTTSYSGEISGLGSSIKINSLNTPTIAAYTPNSTSISPEQLKDESRILTIDNANYFAFLLDDVDQKQATGGLLEEGLRKAVIGLKDAAEVVIAGLYTQAGTTITYATFDTASAFSTIMKAKTALLANNVPEDGIILEISPYIYQKLILADILHTDNSERSKSGKWSDALGLNIFISNNLTTTVTSADVVQTQCLMRTKEAIAYAEQIMKTEKYMPESSFSEAVKGLHVFGAKVIKPKELVCLDLKTAAESTI